MKLTRIICLIFILVPFLLTAQNQQQSARPKYAPWGEKHVNTWDANGKQGEWKYYNRDKAILYSITYKDDIKHGPSIRYYTSNGVVREEANFHYGVRDGEYRNYYSNGQINNEGAYKNNRKDGQWTSYYKSSGEKKFEGNFVMGIKDGQWIFYDSRGNKTIQGTYKMGIKNGTWTKYNSEGKVTETSIYVNGVLQSKDGTAVPAAKPKTTAKPGATKPGTVKPGTTKPATPVKTTTPASGNDTIPKSK